MNLKKLLIVLIVLTSAYLIHAQEFEIPLNRGARNAALGDANLSEGNDVSSVYLNPASLVFIKESSVFFNHTRLRNKYGMMENLAATVIQKKTWNLSAGFETYHMGYIQEHPDLPKQQILEFNYHLSGAYAIVPTFSVGVTAGFRSGETDSSKAWGQYYVIGINYSPSADVNYGAAFFGLGDAIRYSQKDSTVFAGRFIPDKRLVLGASMRYPSAASLRRTIFVLSLANEKIFGVSGIFYKAGIEIRPLNYLNLRLGYTLGPDVSEPRFGIGVNFKMFVLEYTIFAGPSSSINEQISLAVKF